MSYDFVGDAAEEESAFLAVAFEADEDDVGVVFFCDEEDFVGGVACFDDDVDFADFVFDCFGDFGEVFHGFFFEGAGLDDLAEVDGGEEHVGEGGFDEGLGDDGEKDDFVFRCCAVDGGVDGALAGVGAVIGNQEFFHAGAYTGMVVKRFGSDAGVSGRGRR